MRGQKKIIIQIDENGNCEIEGNGFIGPECAHFIEEIESALGQQTSIKDKPEYRQRQIIGNKNRQRTGR